MGAGGQAAAIDRAEGERGEAAGARRQGGGGAPPAMRAGDAAVAGGQARRERPQTRQVAQGNERAVADPPARAPGPARADPENDRAPRREFAAPPAEMPAQTDHRGVAGALKDELDSDILGRSD